MKIKRTLASRWQVVSAVICFQLLIAQATRAANDCIEDGPYFGPWTCNGSASLTGGSLSSLSVNICPGDTITPPTAIAPTIVNGSMKRQVTYRCVENPGYMETASLRYVASNVYFVPSIPNQINSPGTVLCAGNIDVFPTSVLAWWPGDGTTTESVYGHNCQLMNGATYTSGQVGQGFSFNGIGAYVSVPDSPVLNCGSSSDLSMECWIKVPYGSAGSQTIIDKRGYVGGRLQGYYYYLSNGRPAFEMHTSVGVNTITATGSDLRDSNFHHVAVTMHRDIQLGMVIYIYVDGVRRTTSGVAYNYINGDLYNSSALYIGHRAVPGPLGWDFFKGVIDEPALYGCSLSATDVLSIFTSGMRNQAKNLLQLPKMPFCTTITRNIGAVTITVGPRIVTQPADLTAIAGQSGTFSVQATGASSYQWRKNGANIFGATSSSYTASPVALSDSGSVYDVVVSCGSSSIVSRQASLTVQAGAPIIISQPASQSPNVGSVVSMRVIANGTGTLNYQWKKEGVNIANGSKYSGTTTDTLTISDNQTADNGGYTVVVSNPSGTITSAAATLTVRPLGNDCPLYPIGLPSSILGNGNVIEIPDDSTPGAFAWLTWSGAQGTLAGNLSDPYNAWKVYKEPGTGDTILKKGKWISVNPGTVKSVDDIMAGLVNSLMMLPVWDITNGLTGNNAAYRLYHYAQVQLKGYRIAGNTRYIRVQYLGVGSCDNEPGVSFSTERLIFKENDPVTQIDPAASAWGGISSFNNIRLTLSFQSNGLTEDQLGIQNEGSGVGQININGNQVGYGSTVIGTVGSVNNGVNGAALEITFNSSCTLGALKALMRHITYYNVSENPSSLARVVKAEMKDQYGVLNETPATIIINVIPVDDAPTLTTTATLTGATEDTPFTISYSTLQQAASGFADLDNSPVYFRIDSGVSGTLTKSGSPIAIGVTTLGPGESLIWTPPADQNGTALPSFSVKAFDGNLASSALVDVKVTVSEVNDNPIANPDSFITTAGTSMSLPTGYFLANDLPGPANESAQTLSFISVSTSSARGGTVSVSGSTVTYTPPTGYSGEDTFTYSVRDNGTTGGVADYKTSTGTVTVSVIAGNRPPTLTTVTPLSGVEDTDLSISYSMLASAADEADPDNSTIYFRVESVSSGTLTKNGTSVVNGSTLLGPGETWVWHPAQDDNGSGLNAFTIKAYDGSLASITAIQVIVNVSEVNDAPTATTDTPTTLEDTPLTFAANNLLANDSKGPANESGQTLTVTAVGTSSIQGGVVAFSGGNVTYTPPPNFFGNDTFTYTIRDNGTTSGNADFKTAQGNVVVNVVPVNDQPTLDPIADMTRPAGFSYTVNLTGTSAGPREENQSLTFTATTDNPDVISELRYPWTSTSPNPGNLTFKIATWGTATITVTVKDDGGTANGGIDTISRTFKVTGTGPLTVNAGPAQTILLPVKAILNGSVSGGTQPYSSIAWSKITGPSGGTVTFTDNPIAPGNPAKQIASFSIPGDYVLQFSASDNSGSGGSDSLVVTVLQNQPPIVSAGPNRTATVGGDLGLLGTLKDDGLPDGRTIDIQWSSDDPAHVTFLDPQSLKCPVHFSAAGTFHLTLTATERIGSDTFLSASDEANVIVSDGNSRTYTWNADFQEGALRNLNFNEVPNELRLNKTITPLPYVYFACSDRGTIVRIDINTGQIVGEYATAPGSAADRKSKVWPSRVSVDSKGNVWVSNSGDRWVDPADNITKSSVTRIGIVIGGTRGRKDGSTFVPDPNGDYLAPPFIYNTCVDRFGTTPADPPDGLIKTSRGKGDVRPWTNTGGVDTAGGVSTAEDECIMNFVRVLPTAKGQ